MTDADFSPRATARWAGLLYFVNAACGLWAEVFVRAKVIVSGDAAATAANILANQTLYRSGFAADLVSMVTELFIALLFYRLFRPVSHSLSMGMVLFRLAWVAIFATVALTHIAPLLLLDGSLKGLDVGQVQALSYFSLRLHGQGYEVGLIFFGVDCFLIGLLIWRSNFLPKILGVMLGVAGLCYLVESFANFLAPALGHQFGMWLLLPCAVAEYALILWLLIVGVNATKWRRQAGVTS
ncbi:MAG: DUF4386 domain-containing protein [Alphaproteobacteria bacterium]|nr:DUF4386 domain-containing protein [Alphaproteobacteria bacterium]